MVLLLSASITKELRSIKSNMSSSKTHIQLQIDVEVMPRLRMGRTKLTHALLLSGFEVSLCALCNLMLAVPHILVK